MNASVSQLHAGFLSSVRRFPQRPALEVAGQVFSYQELFDRAAALALVIREVHDTQGPPLVAVLADRSPTAYIGVLATLLAGYGYVPLHPQFPAARTRLMLSRSDCRTVIVDPAGMAIASEALADHETPRTLLIPEPCDATALAERLPATRIVAEAPRHAAADWQPRAGDPNQIAYLLFTSGTTGVPKGVMVAHRNVAHFMDFVVDRYEISSTDRLSQTFDLVFDLSVFDLFAAWQCGACVCVPSREELLMPARYIADARLTVWFSVPSVARLMKRLGLLEPGTLSNLRVSLFCGEALTVETAQSWQQAAPQSIVENLYGPTELTLCCTYYRWHEPASAAESHNSVVPIGAPFPQAKVLIADASLRAVDEGQSGELLIAGPQVALGYFRDPERTAQAFVEPPGCDEVYYRTGDRVCRAHPDGPLFYLGRVDDQLKVRGNRLELGEIESALRSATGTDSVAAVGWPLTEAGADAIVAFVVGAPGDWGTIRAALAGLLPPYAVPKQVRFVEELPLNPNGKIDRVELRRWCEPRHEHPQEPVADVVASAPARGTSHDAADA